MSMSMSKAEDESRARLAAHASWANTEDRTARTEAAREALQRRFEREVDPDGVLDPEERRKRADNARKAHMERLRLASLKSRRLRREAKCAAKLNEQADGGWS